MPNGALIVSWCGRRTNLEDIKLLQRQRRKVIVSASTVRLFDYRGQQCKPTYPLSGGCYSLSLATSADPGFLVQGIDAKSLALGDSLVSNQSPGSDLHDGWLCAMIGFARNFSTYVGKHGSVVAMPPAAWPVYLLTRSRPVQAEAYGILTVTG
jgi:hypothetical protein